MGYRGSKCGIGNSTRDFSKRINFTRVDLFVWSTLVVKIKKTQESTPSILGEHNFTTVVSLLSVWVSFHMFWALLFSSTKITEPMHFWTWGFCVHFVPRFDATDFRDTSLTICTEYCRTATSTEKRQKVGLFQRFFHPSMSIFPRFPTFPAFSNFYSRIRD